MPLLVLSYLDIRQALHQRVIMERLEQENLVQLQIPAAELLWHKKGKELIHNHRYFDLHSLEKHGNYFLVTGMYDDMEDKLEQEIDKAAQASQSTSFAENGIFLSWFPHPIPMDLQATIVDSVVRQYLQWTQDPVSQAGEPGTPPPNFAPLYL